MTITEKILERIASKNPKARKRMARRYARKVKRGLNERYTELEMRLHGMLKVPSARQRRDRLRLEKESKAKAELWIAEIVRRIKSEPICE